MDRRVFLAVILAVIVMVVTPLVFPGASHPAMQDSISLDSGATKSGANNGSEERGSDSLKLNEAGKPPAPARTSTLVPIADKTPAVISDSTSVHSPHMTVWYADAEAAPLRVALKDYQDRKAGATGVVELRPMERKPLLRYDVILGDSSFQVTNGTASPTNVASAPGRSATFRGSVEQHPVTIQYTSPTTNADRYLLHVSVDVGSATPKTSVQITLPGSLASAETDTTDDIRHLAFGYKPKAGDVQSLLFAKLDSGAIKDAAGPLDWVAVRDKYFLVALIAPGTSIASATFVGGPKVNKLAPHAIGSLILPLHDGHVDFDLYVGPQEYQRLHAFGHDLDHVNPYAGWLRGVIQPFATAVTWVLLWMKQTSGLGYGWVIIIFGVAIRLALWPLNQKAMRTSIRMQRIQPELAEVQRKYKSDPDKQREALVKLYQAHGMTPFSPMMGCLPMLIPMPILYALYFVFLNTIEFRGVSFLWIRDISAADPYYITPVIMGLSMFAVSWIGMKGTPPTSQTRMMTYMMPIVMTVVFFRFAAGLNLYYAVQTIVSLPQQWLLARERAASTPGGGSTASMATGLRTKT